MSQTNPSETRQASPKWDDRERIPARAIALAASGILLFLILLLPVMSSLLRAFGAVEPSAGANLQANAGQRAATPWESPAADLAAQRSREQEHLEQYRWIDRERGVVQIPIERAMELVVAHEQDESGADGSPGSEGSSNE